MLEIRSAPVSLLPVILDAARDTWDAHRARQPFAFGRGDLENFVIPGLTQAFHDETGQIAASSDRVFAATIDGAFAGYVVLTPLTLPDGSPPPHINIDDIYVAPAFRRQGVATALLAHVKALADQHDWDNLNASVWTGNDSSQKLFEKAGFAPLTTTLRYGPDRQVRDTPIPGALQSPSGQKIGDTVILIIAICAVIAVVLTLLT